MDFVFSFSSLPTIGGVTHNSLPFQSASFLLIEHVGDFLCWRRTQMALPYPSYFTPNLVAHKVKIVSCKTRYPCLYTFKSFKIKSCKRSLATQTILWFYFNFKIWDCFHTISQLYYYFTLKIVSFPRLEWYTLFNSWLSWVMASSIGVLYFQGWISCVFLISYSSAEL